MLHKIFFLDNLLYYDTVNCRGGIFMTQHIDTVNTAEPTESLESLESIENKIIALSQQDANRWAEMAQLMIAVDEKKLYAQENSSFSQWLRELAERAKVHESLLWRRLKAGRFYLKMKKLEPTLPDMSTVKISPDNFVLIKDIVGNNIEEAKKLIKKVLDGTMTRKDLKAAKFAIIKQREAAGIKRAVNGYERQKLEANPEKASEIAIRTGITAAKILLTIQQNSDWLPAIDMSESKKYMREKYKSIYRVLSEFPVETGDTQRVRRIDAFVLENVTSQEPKDMTLRGIEIKISRGDLLRDEKMSEYALYCDYFYVAVPPELKDDALSIMSPEWGLLLIQGESIFVEKESKQLPGIMRNEALSTALYECL